MAVALTAENSTARNGAGDPVSNSFNIDLGGASMAAMGGWAQGVPAVSFTFNGDAGTIVKTTNDIATAVLFSPDSGSNAFVFTWTNGGASTQGIAGYSGTITSGVADTDYATASNTGTGTAWSVTITPKASSSELFGHFRFAFNLSNDGADTATFTNGNQQVSGCRYQRYTATVTAATPATFNSNLETSAAWSYNAVEVRAAGGGGGGAVAIMPTLLLLGIG